MSENENGTVGTAVIVRPTSLPSVQEMRNKLEQRREVRALLLTYLREEMTEGQHFGTIPGTNSPMLYQDGARLVQTIFDVTSGKPELDEEYSEEGHYRCTATVPLVSLATGEILYYGVGTCSTREAKYAHRWVYDNEVPHDIDMALLKSVTKPKKGGKGTYTKYLLPNPDLGDLHHTILTMALKRADTRATMKLPSVGDIFMEPDAKDSEDVDEERSAALDKLRAWFRTCPFEQRDSVASLVFRVRSQKALSELATDMLTEGTAILETADLDWASATLGDDYKAWQHARGARSSVELFGDDPAPVEHFVPEKKEQVEGLGLTGTPKLAEDPGGPLAPAAERNEKAWGAFDEPQTQEKPAADEEPVLDVPARTRASKRLEALKSAAQQEVGKLAKKLGCVEGPIWEYMEAHGFDIDDLSPAILKEFTGQLGYYEMGGGPVSSEEDDETPIGPHEAILCTIDRLARQHKISAGAVRQRVEEMFPGHLEGIENVHPAELTWYCGVIEGVFQESTPVDAASETHDTSV